MSRHPQISEAEWQVMEVIWSRHPIVAQDVVERLKGKVTWSPRTVKTLLNRLVKKGALSYEEEGKRYWYAPRVKREECVRQESRSFLSRVFAGRAGEMLCRFVDEVELTPEEVRQLKKILERKGKRDER
jgi:BlaI family penicillinase repressor